MTWVRQPAAHVTFVHVLSFRTMDKAPGHGHAKVPTSS